MRIVFHGQNAAAFSGGFAALVGQDVEVVILPDVLASAADQGAFTGADVIIGTRFDATMPRPQALRLFHVPGAGYDSVDLDALPAGVTVCNCFGHEHAIAEYVMAALLRRCVIFLGHDSGVTHVAAASSRELPVPTLCTPICMS